jgi:hypothetical protein
VIPGISRTSPTGSFLQGKLLIYSGCLHMGGIFNTYSKLILFSVPFSSLKPLSYPNPVSQQWHSQSKKLKKSLHCIWIQGLLLPRQAC